MASGERRYSLQEADDIRLRLVDLDESELCQGACRFAEEGEDAVNDTVNAEFLEVRCNNVIQQMAKGHREVA
jgi:hypothetical protein